ncbi:CsgG/HfaB family protein [Halosquirtibacter xylanolyticus]|uniref:CsgG/HfaB family protein n=1 Tax=Halosquirtibacter xylanolyticus TaxID=3374599 RepID=UPI003749DEB9|nr:CsgG/HfaB family protein [Prolixibacteraceae bacterium]
MRKRLFLIALCLFTFSSYAQDVEQTKALKRKVAIGRFSNVTKQSQSIFYDQESDQLGKQASDILAMKLVSSDKFLLIERQDYDKIANELIQTNRLSDTTSTQIGADFLIIGSVTHLGRKTVGNQKLFSSSIKQEVEAGVSLRLVDVSTGLIVFSGEGKGNSTVQDKKVMGFGERADFDATLTDKAISAAINQLVEEIINKCMDMPWKAYILSEEDGSYILSGGASQGIQVGDKYDILKPGKSVKNPQTGMMIQLPGKVIGELQIDMTFGDTPSTEVSMATLVSGDIQKDQLSKYVVIEKK